MAAREFNRMILNRLRSALQQLGYKSLTASLFVRPEKDVLLLVELQKSKYSTKEHLEITVNLGALSLPLAQQLGRDHLPPDIGLCHWTMRIGELMPEQQDIWWRVDTMGEANVAADEIVRAVTQVGLPALELVSSTKKLFSLWKAGHCQGLTEFQRRQYVSLLDQTFGHDS